MVSRWLSVIKAVDSHGGGGGGSGDGLGLGTGLDGPDGPDGPDRAPCLLSPDLVAFFLLVLYAGR